MGSRKPWSPDGGEAPARGKKKAPRDLNVKLDMGRGKGRVVRSGRAVLTEEELRFHTGRTGREGADFNLHLRYEEIARVVLLPDGASLTVTTQDGTDHTFHVGKHAPAWKEMVEARPGVLSVLGVRADTRFASTYLPDEELQAALASRAQPEDAAELDLLFVGAAHPSDLARLRELARRVRQRGGALWVVYPVGTRGLDESDVAAAGRAAGLVAGAAVTISRAYEALKLLVPGGSPGGSPQTGDGNVR
jgi:hypothetical protein